MLIRWTEAVCAVLGDVVILGAAPGWLHSSVDKQQELAGAQIGLAAWQHQQQSGKPTWGASHASRLVPLIIGTLLCLARGWAVFQWLTPFSPDNMCCLALLACSSHCSCTAWLHARHCVAWQNAMLVA